MNKIVEILMKRDGLSKEEANDLFEETQKEIGYLVGSGSPYDEIEDTMSDMLGLEMDYIYDLLNI